MEKSLDIVALGECLVEFAELDRGLYRQSYAGDTLNSLYYASRLGLRTGYITATGDDSFTEGILELLDGVHIDRSHVLTVPGQNGLYFIRQEARASRLHFLRDRSAARSLFAHTDVSSLTGYIAQARFFLTSLIAAGMLIDKERFLELVRAASEHTRIAFDTNYRSSVWTSPDEARQWLEAIIPFVHVLFVTDDDDKAIYGERSTMEIVRHYQSLGVGHLVLRMGVKGSLVVEGKAEGVRAMQDIPVVDTTGAGDAYTAGYLSKLLVGAPARTCAEFATACAALAIGEHGGMSPSFRSSRVEELIKLNEETSAF